MYFKVGFFLSIDSALLFIAIGCLREAPRHRTHGMLAPMVKAASRRAFQQGSKLRLDLAIPSFLFQCPG